jgi:ABC-type antimicrobial peptide transport system permease subunit
MRNSLVIASFTLGVAAVFLLTSKARADDVNTLSISIPAVIETIPSVVNPGENVPVDSAVMRHRGFACFQGVPLIRFEAGGALSDSTVNKISIYVDPAFPKIDGSGYREVSLDFTVKAISDKGINYGRSAINYHEIIQVVDSKEFSHQLTSLVGSNQAVASAEATVSYKDNVGKNKNCLKRNWTE